LGLAPVALADKPLRQPEIRPEVVDM
jgi:hypothetical protein